MSKKGSSRVQPPVSSGFSMHRRAFLKTALGALVLGPALLNCGETITEPRQFNMSVEGYKGLAELPFVELTADGKLKFTDTDLPLATDFHCHLAFAVGQSPDVDFQQKTDKVGYIMDCDGAKDPACTFNMDDYINKIATPKMLDHVDEEIARSGLTGGVDAKTHTIPNLIEERELARVGRSVLLPIAVNIGFGRDDMVQQWKDGLEKSGKKDSFVLFGSVHPEPKEVHYQGKTAIDLLRDLHQQGFRGIKFHPTIQSVAPNNPKAMELFEECQKLGMAVFFHSGRAGIEAGNNGDYAKMENYKEPLSKFKDMQFIFGHAGARDHAEALALAKQHDNVWLETHGQGVTSLRTIAKEFDQSRILFGTDWPWYPLVATMAKVRIAFDGNPPLLRKVFAENADRLLKMINAA
ncbi:MAG: amidohydrolase family protein [Myxococcales bacterium]|nr:amidohydrolase family protein [Myxococcales bacterium]MCB9642732.1 amidohydrolase family protein [Myxococcales bacterium]